VLVTFILKALEVDSFLGFLWTTTTENPIEKMMIEMGELYDNMEIIGEEQGAGSSEKLCATFCKEDIRGTYGRGRGNCTVMRYVKDTYNQGWNPITKRQGADEDLKGPLRNTVPGTIKIEKSCFFIGWGRYNRGHRTFTTRNRVPGYDERRKETGMILQSPGTAGAKKIFERVNCICLP